MDFVTKIREQLEEWLDRRRAPRKRLRVCAFYWDGANSLPHDVRDISCMGAYIVTDIKWYRGTVMEVILEPGTAATTNGHRPDVSHRISSRVVRVESDGIGVEFLHRDPKERRTFARLLRKLSENGASPHSNHDSERGQSLIEFALIVPLLLLLIVNVVNFGAFFFAWVTVANAARAGAQYMAMGGATVGGPRAPSAAQVRTVVLNDAANLPNSGSLAVRICTNNNGTSSCDPTTGTYPPATDPEPTNYVVGSVDVTYTYVPLIPLFNFNGLGIHATIPPTAMHRRSVMRIMQ